MHTLFFFFFNDTATTEIYPLSLHDALPIYPAPGTVGSGLRSRGHRGGPRRQSRRRRGPARRLAAGWGAADRKSTRLNSSHSQISYAVFCLKKKKKLKNYTQTRVREDVTTRR